MCMSGGVWLRLAACNSAPFSPIQESTLEDKGGQVIITGDKTFSTLQLSFLSVEFIYRFSILCIWYFTNIYWSNSAEDELDTAMNYHHDSRNFQGVFTIYCVLTVLSTLHVLTHLIFTTVFCCIIIMFWNYTHFKDKETEAQRIEIACASVTASKQQSVGSNQAV